MNWKKVICWLKGHEYMVISVQHHHPAKKEFLYQCTRCGRQTRYRYAAEEFANIIAESKAERVLNQKQEDG